MPEGTKYVGRPTQWENPFQVVDGDADLAVKQFAIHLVSYFGWEDMMMRRAFHPLPVRSTAFESWLAPLRGRDLACWCPLDQPCHADVLLELANR